MSPTRPDPLRLSDRQHGTSSREERKKKNVSYKLSRRANRKGKKCLEEPNISGSRWSSGAAAVAEEDDQLAVYKKKKKNPIWMKETSPDPVSHEARVQNVQ